jgi:hypothetical protein
MSESPVPPSLPQMAAKVTSSALSWVKGGFALTPAAQVEERMAICKPCNYYDADGFGGSGRCLNCGCLIPAKIRLATERCPLSKW